MRRPLNVLSRLDAGIRRRFLIPAKRWLTLQRFTAIVMALYALSLATTPTVPVVTLSHSINIDGLPVLFALVFAFCAALLLGKPVPEVRYRLLLLPLFLYFGVQVWYVLAVPVNPNTGNPTSWSGAIGALAVWGFFNIAGTQLPPDDGAAHDAGSQ